MIQSKLPDVGTTIFTTMSKLSSDHKAINLGQGFPEFDPDDKLIELVHQAMKQGHNQYPYMPGIDILRQQIAVKMNRLYFAEYDPETEITVTNGASEALMSAILAVVNTGDEVIVIEPCYDSYAPSIRLAGGTPIYVPLEAPNSEHNSFRIDWNRVEQSITAKTTLMILNFPHNPTGITLNQSDLDAIEAIILRHNILLISDEVYEHIVFDEKPFLSLSTRPSIASRTFVISSFGKTYHTTGWKVGYCVAPAAMMSEFRRIHQFVVFTVSSPMQYAFAEYMQDPTTYEKLAFFYQIKHDFLFEALLQTPFKPIRSDGTFFLLADYSAISSEDELSFTKNLTIQHGVSLIPVSAFYKNPLSGEANNYLVRFCFAKTQETLEKAILRLQAL